MPTVPDDIKTFEIGTKACRIPKFPARHSGGKLKSSGLLFAEQPGADPLRQHERQHRVMPDKVVVESGRDMQHDHQPGDPSQQYFVTMIIKAPEMNGKSTDVSDLQCQSEQNVIGIILTRHAP